MITNPFVKFNPVSVNLPMEVRLLTTLANIDPHQWNALLSSDNPFVRHEFLYALEESGCVGEGTGWLPRYIAVFEDSNLVAAAPVYAKTHSYGEYVFDWAWARAYERAGLAYYPKLVVAIPFTPVSGPRLLIHPNVSYPDTVVNLVLDAVEQLAQSMGASSTHWLFITEADAAHLHTHAPIERIDCQFHWENEAYRDFDHFLTALSHKKRKNIRQERRSVLHAGVSLSVTPATHTTARCWHDFHRLYERTCHGKGGVAYLNTRFFATLSTRLPDRLLLIRAHLDGELIAAAFCLRDQTTLYGRSWGTAVELPGLHFETCYYTPIEYCITHGIQRFEAGAQGAHKLSRGFLPTQTVSRHWIAEPAFRGALTRYVSEESQHVATWMDELNAHTPYHHDAARKTSNGDCS